MMSAVKHSFELTEGNGVMNPISTFKLSCPYPYQFQFLSQESRVCTVGSCHYSCCSKWLTVGEEAGTCALAQGLDDQGRNSVCKIKIM